MTVDAATLRDLQARAAAPEQLRRELARRVGCALDAPTAVVLAALDEALSEAADLAVQPAGTELVESEALAQLRVNAELGRTERERNLVDSAIRDGRIPPASRASWLTLMRTDRAAESTLATLKRGLIPVAEVGYTNETDPDTDRLYGSRH